MTPRSARLADDVLADIQGFIASGYGHLSRAAYLFVQFHDAGQAQRWLRRLTPAITSARPWPIASNGEKVKPPVTLNIAFSADGLAAVGLPPQVLCTFPLEFQEGIASPIRSKILGDTEESDPVEWELGGTGKPPIHAVLLVHAASEAGLEAACRAQRSLLDDAAGGVVELPGSMQIGYRPDGDHEPFGFHDGIAQPSIAGITGDGVPTGEFILGYQNHYQIIPPTPVVPAELDRDARPASAGQPLSRVTAAARSRHQRLLRRVPQASAGCRGVLAVHETRSRPEHGRGGRRSHDLAGVTLRRAMAQRRAAGSGARRRRSSSWRPRRLSVRRRPGWPGLPARRAHPPDQPARRHQAVRDRSIAQHVRGPSAAPSSARVRTGVVRSDDPGRSHVWRGRTALLELADDGHARGIHFFCVNASIRSQFEFVQQTWCNNPRFGGLNDNKDPILGDNARTDRTSSHMTIPRRPFRLRTAALPRFVTVRAGAYLFMPSLTALRFLAAFRRR